MPPKIEKERENVVNIDISDDEGSAGVGMRTNNASSNETASQQQLSSAPSNSNPNKNLEYRSFWKAGAYDVGPTSRASTEYGRF